jgi:hypothetical protein
MVRRNDPQCQPLSSAEADEILDALPAGPVVPPVPGQDDLPFNALWPGQFERLSKRLIKRDAEVEHCYLYGKPGEKQFGIDIVARRADGQRWAYQCKRYESYTLGNLRKALEKLTYPADRYIFAVSCDVGRALRDEVEGRSPPTEIWGVHELSDKLRDCPGLVTQFFGPDWCRVFCGVSPALSVHDYLDAVDEYCRKFPYLSLDALIGGADREAPPSLSETYVRLQAQPRPKERRSPETSEAEEGEPDERDLRPEAPVFVEQALGEHTRLVILGEAGAGKSTLLRHLAECAWKNPAGIGLDAPHLPVLVPLRRVAAAGALPARLGHALSAELPLVRDLPADFFTAWPLQTGARWLLLLDGLDEVPAQERRAVANLLEGWARQAGGHRLIVTSRTAGYEALDAEAFRHYTLLPFDPKQVSDFAVKWFTDDAAKFQDELDRVRVGALAGTPLLLTIAAAVYWRWHELPPRRSGLYGQFVAILLEEDERRPEVRDALGDLLDYRRPILERIALWCQEELRGGLMPERAFEAQVARILRDEKGLRPFEVEAQVKRYVQAVRERGGLLVRRGDALDFIHPTFREYLAACALRHQSWAEVDEVIRTRWADDAWREVMLFLLGLLSDEGKDVSGLVQDILDSGEEGLYFAAACLAEQVTVDEKLSDRIVDDLLSAARSGKRSPYGEVTALGGLQGNERAVAALLALACDEEVIEWVHVEAAVTLGKLDLAEEAAAILLALARDRGVYVRVRMEAARALGELGCAKDLLTLACDGGVDELVRVQAAVALGKLDCAGEASQAWLTLGRDDRVDAEVRVRAAVELGRLDCAEEASQAWLALVRDKGVDMGIRERATEGLSELRRVDDLLALAHDEGLCVRLRKRAAVVLDELSCEATAQAWLALARDEGVVEWEREQAAAALGGLNRVEDLLALAHDEGVYAGVRRRAAVALGDLGCEEEAVAILLALALDGGVCAEVRELAAIALGRLNCEAKAAQAWLALALGRMVYVRVRERATVVLCELGRVEELLALARDDEVEAWVRERAAVALGKMGQASPELLSDLRALADDPQTPKRVRRAARESLERLERSSHDPPHHSPN